MPNSSVHTLKKSVPKVSLKLRIRVTDGSRRYAEPAYSANGKLRPLYAVVNGKAELHPEGVYAVRRARNGVRVWETVGSDSQLAMTTKMRLEHSVRAVSLGLAPSEPDDAQGAVGTDLDEAIASYLEDTAALKSRKTFKAYALTLRGFREVCAKPRFLEAVTRRDLFTYIASLKSEGCAPRTIANRIAFLKTFYSRWKAAWPMEKTDKVRYTEKKVTIYSHRELQAMLGVADQEEKELISFFLYTGAREQEVQFATWADIDFDAKTFTIREKLDLGFTPKDREEGSIPLPDHFVAMLRARQLRSRGTRLIFSTPDGGTNGHMLRVVKRIALTAGLNCGHCVAKDGRCCAIAPVCSKYILHRFRKTFATLNHRAGVPVRTIQGWLRHSSLDTTLVYLAGAEDASDSTRQQVNSTFAAFADAA